MGVQNPAGSVASAWHCPGPLDTKTRSVAPAVGSAKGGPIAGAISERTDNVWRGAVRAPGARPLPAVGTAAPRGGPAAGTPGGAGSPQGRASHRQPRGGKGGTAGKTGRGT